MQSVKMARVAADLCLNMDDVCGIIRSIHKVAVTLAAALAVLSADAKQVVYFGTVCEATTYADVSVPVPTATAKTFYDTTV